MDVIAIGETMLLVAPAPGQGLAVDSTFVVGPGGAESNVAIALANFGVDAAWLSRVGADPIGELLTDAIAAHGVDTSLVEVVPGMPTGVYFKRPMGGSTQVIYYRTGSAASSMSPELLGRLPELRPRIVHMSGITAALSTECADLARAVIVERHFPEALVAFDVNYRAALWPSRERAAKELLVLAAAADIVLVGLDEADVLWGTATAEDVRALLPNVAHLIVKDGAIEAVEFSAGATTRVPARPVTVVEPVGAGDAFAAGWEASFLAGDDARARLEAGHASAAAALMSATDLAVPGQSIDEELQ